jgi:hypothetical protein
MLDNNLHSTPTNREQVSSPLAQVKAPHLNSAFPAAAQPDISKWLYVLELRIFYRYSFITEQ